MVLARLKELVISLVDIPEWEPTDSQAAEVHRLLNKTKPSTPDELKAIVYEACNISERATLEGIDNSDLNAVLALAVQPLKTK